jgi:hypothetical protein
MFTFLGIGLPGEAAHPQLLRHCPLQIVQDMRHRPQVIDRCVQRIAAPTLFQFYFGAIFSRSKKLAGKFKYSFLSQFCKNGGKFKINRGIFLDFQYFIQHASSAAPPLRFPLFRLMLGSNPGQLRLRHWLSEAFTTRLDLIHTRQDLIHTRLDLIHAQLDLI